MRLKKRLNSFGMIALTAVIVSIFGSCKVPFNTDNAIGVAITPSTLILFKDDTVNLTASVFPVGAVNKAVTWRSENEDIATVDPDGNVTISNTNWGPTRIYATTVDGNKQAFCEIAVLSDPIIVLEDDPSATLAQKLKWLQDNAQSCGMYIVEVGSSELIGPHTLSYGKNKEIFKNIFIRLWGDGGSKNVFLTSKGSMFTIGSGVTLTVDNNIILNGISNNTHPLVVVNNEGELIMESGSQIKGNKAPSAYGGGVCVNNGGTFTFNGGTIGTSLSDPPISSPPSPPNRENTANRGGGVYVKNGGIFIMKNGTIRNNEAVANSGGGVYVETGGKFEMGNGSIRDNEAKQAGGGVYMQTKSTFTMNGSSTISGNKSYDSGGGVYVYGTFTMNNNSVISGNESTNAYGGGVRVNGGTFTMNGSSTISGNKSRSFGGGVFIDSGTFTMNNSSVISGNESTNESINTYANGGGVRVSGSGYFIMNNGTINNNTAKTDGGGVSLDGNGRFAMKNGIIRGNKGRNGGGVHIWGSGQFRIMNGTIYGGNEITSANRNNAQQAGHAVEVKSNGTLQYGVFKDSNPLWAWSTKNGEKKDSTFNNNVVVTNGNGKF